MAALGEPDLQSANILVVEGDFLAAENIADEIRMRNGKVIGPAPTIEQALQLLKGRRPDAAVLNVLLQQRAAIPIVDRLRDLQVPFVVVSGLDPEMLPETLRIARHVAKPYAGKTLISQLVEALESDAAGHDRFERVVPAAN